MRDRTKLGPISIGGTKLLNVGTGADGNVLIDRGSVDLTSTLNGDPIVMNYNNLTIDATFTLSVSNPCKGLFIYVKHDLIVNGTISMNSKGATGTPTQPITILAGNVPKDAFIGDSLIYSIPIKGGLGGIGAGGIGPNGSDGLYGETGGGAAGGAASSYNGHNGFNGTRYDGGIGGNGGGTTSYGLGGTPGGGVLVILVGGDITIGAAAVISANGVKGSNGVTGGGGGGSGGGSIIILCNGTLTNSGSVVASGGAGGTGHFAGGVGGAGSVQILKAT